MKTILRTLSLTLILILALSFVGCSEEKKMDGTWVHSSGEIFLFLYEDGSAACYYNDEYLNSIDLGTWTQDGTSVLVEYSNDILNDDLKYEKSTERLIANNDNYYERATEDISLPTFAQGDLDYLGIVGSENSMVQFYDGTWFATNYDTEEQYSGTYTLIDGELTVEDTDGNVYYPTLSDDRTRVEISEDLILEKKDL